MAFGRPSKYRKEMCDTVIECMSQGMSKTELLLEIDVNWSTLCEWCNPEGDYYKPDFSKAVKEGERLSQAWWERLGRRGSSGESEIQPTTYIFNMKNRFKEDWKDISTSRQTGEDGGPVQVEVTMKQLLEQADGADTGIGPAKSRRGD